MGFLDRLLENPIVSTTVKGTTFLYTLLTESLWPIYCCSIIISIFPLLGVSQEKQILADHLYGNGNNMTVEIAKEAAVLLDEESNIAIKHQVWGLSGGDFRREYVARHGGSI
eukprot:Tbor_TRINITY_DN5765_c3_g1::TRINITY_DN5765_c3_g1_i1::g.20151::m.20151